MICKLCLGRNEAVFSQICNNIFDSICFQRYMATIYEKIWYFNVN